jgi:hypothetical protein
MNILSTMKSWIGNFQPRTYRDALDAWGEVARKGSAPADPNDLLHEVPLAGGARLMAVRSANGKVLAVISMD